MVATSSRRHRRQLRMKIGALGFLVWLCGFFLITVFLYSTLQRQQHHKNHHKIGRSSSGFDGDSPLNIAIFSAPRPFYREGMDLVGARQELAVRSWLALSPNVAVVLFGKHPSVLRLAAKLGPRVVVESGIDFSFLGTPFFHSMIAKSQFSQSDVTVLIDPETILLPETYNILHHTHKLNRDWFLISMTPSISNFPFHIDKIGKHWLQRDGRKAGDEKLQEFLYQRQNWSNCGERLVIAWNTGDLPLHSGVLPPFLYGKGLHNEWLLNEVLSSGFRFVIDTGVVTISFYPESLGQQFSNLLQKDSNIRREKSWEYMGNHHLATVYGTLYFQPNKILPVKLLKCVGQYLFIDPAKNTSYLLQGPNEHASSSLEPGLGRAQKHSWLPKRFLQLWRQKKLMDCVEYFNLLDRKNLCSVVEGNKAPLKMSMPFTFPFSLESLLQIIADKDRSVVLALAGDNYRDMLMNWVCRLRHLAVTNFIVCALDPEIYQFSLLLGLPVFRDPLAPRNISFNDCHFGTKCFQSVTKVKSRIVLQILKLGYNVLLSDVDVYWFKNPLPFLHSFGPNTLVAQSDEYNKTGPINLPRRLNSGFYFARSDSATVAALKKVVKHASTSDLSEQPSFYDVLCGEGGVNRVGDDRCYEPETNLTIVFLNRDLFPNGAYKGLWEKRDVRFSCLKLGCVILHNNWINGRKRKLERQMRSGLWDYDASSRMCLQRWHNANSTKRI